MQFAKPLAKHAFGRAARLFALLFVILGGAVPAVAADDRLAAPTLATASYSPDIGIAQVAPDRWVESGKDRSAADQADDAGALPLASTIAAPAATALPRPAAGQPASAGQSARAYQARAPPIV